MSLMQTPLGAAGVVTPQQVYNTRAKLLSLRGFKNTSDFYTQPPPGPLPPPKPQPPEAVLVANIKAQTDAQKFQAETRQEFEKTKLDAERKTQEMLQQNEIQRQNDERDHQRELARIAAQRDIELAKIEAENQRNERDNNTRLLVAQMGAAAKGVDTNGAMLAPESAESVDPNDDIRNALADIIEAQRAPKSIVYGPDGRPAGVQVGDQFRPAARDAGGNIIGLQ